LRVLPAPQELAARVAQFFAEDEDLSMDVAGLRHQDRDIFDHHGAAPTVGAPRVRKDQLLDHGCQLGDRLPIAARQVNDGVTDRPESLAVLGRAGQQHLATFNQAGQPGFRRHCVQRGPHGRVFQAQGYRVARRAPRVQ